jgi:hypothetical protein
VFANPTNCTAHVQTPILYRQHLYANSFDQYHNKENNGLVCLDLAGNLKWKSGPAATFDSRTPDIGGLEMSAFSVTKAPGSHRTGARSNPGSTISVR